MQAELNEAILTLHREASRLSVYKFKALSKKVITRLLPKHRITWLKCFQCPKSGDILSHNFMCFNHDLECQHQNLKEVIGKSLMCSSYPVVDSFQINENLGYFKIQLSPLLCNLVFISSEVKMNNATRLRFKLFLPHLVQSYKRNVFTMFDVSSTDSMRYVLDSACACIEFEPSKLIPTKSVMSPQEITKSFGCGMESWLDESGLCYFLQSKEGLTHIEIQARSKPLTHKERQILQFLSDAYSDKKIANLLGISSSTVNNHLTSIYQKLGVSNRAQAVNFR